MEDVVLQLKEQAKENGNGDAFTPSAAMTAKEVATYFKKEIPDAHLHLYGKSPKPGRKLGHITVVAPDSETLQARLSAIVALL